MPNKNETQKEEMVRDTLEQIYENPTKENFDRCLFLAQNYIQSAGELTVEDEVAYLVVIELMRDPQGKLADMHRGYIEEKMLGIFTDECSSHFLTEATVNSPSICSFELTKARWEKTLKFMDPLVKRYYKREWGNIVSQLAQPLLIGISDTNDWFIEDMIFGEWGMDLKTLKKIIGPRSYLSYEGLLRYKYSTLDDHGNKPGAWYEELLGEIEQSS